MLLLISVALIAVCTAGERALRSCASCVSVGLVYVLPPSDGRRGCWLHNAGELASPFPQGCLGRSANLPATEFASPSVARSWRFGRRLKSIVIGFALILAVQWMPGGCGFWNGSHHLKFVSS